MLGMLQMLSVLLASMAITPENAVNQLKACADFDEYGTHAVIVECKLTVRDHVSDLLQAAVAKQEGAQASQQAFQAYMQSECERVRQGAENDDLAADQHVLCEVTLMLQRLEALKN